MDPRSARPGDAFPFDRRDLLGVSVAVAERSAAKSYLLSRLQAGQKTAVAFANTNLITMARRFEMAADLSERFVIFNDGVGLDLLSRISHGSAFPDNLNGTDFTADLLGSLRPGTRLFLFGAKPAVVERAAAILERRYPVVVCGTCHGYVSGAEAESLVQRINEAQAELVLVALGNPKQEQWILQHRAALDAPLVMAVGAFLDFTAGSVPRAPLWIRRLRLEWGYRLALEPSRLWRRYTVEAVSLLIAVGQAHRAQQSAARRNALKR